MPWVRARLAEEAVRARETGAQVAVVVFAAGVDLRLGPSDPSVLIDALEASEDQIRGKDLPDIFDGIKKAMKDRGG